MTIKGHNFITDFLLQSQTRSNSNQHDNNTYGNSGNANFYYWCRNTIFIRFVTNNAFSNKKLVIQNSMCLTVFKNTVLLCVLIGISCGNVSKSDDRRPMTEDQPLKHENLLQDNIEVGANSNELYLPMLKGKRV